MNAKNLPDPNVPDPNVPDPNVNDPRADSADQSGLVTGDTVSNLAGMPAGADDLHAVIASLTPEHLASIDVILDQIVSSTDLFDVGPIDTDGTG